MWNVGTKLMILIMLGVSSSVLSTDRIPSTIPSISSLEQLEEHMSELRLCSDKNAASSVECSHFSCMETCLNLKEDPIDCAYTCYFEAKNKTEPNSTFLARRY